MYLNDILLRPTRLLWQAIMVLLYPGVQEASLLEGSQGHVGDGGLGVRGAATSHLVIPTPGSLANTSRGRDASSRVDHSFLNM